jgi:bifunctional non-homologous end joining protein LigD
MREDLMATKVRIEGQEIKISNPDKYLFPDIPLSKWDYVLNLLRLAPYLLPYCRNRTITLIRYPDGVDQGSFYQKHAPHYCPECVETVKQDGEEVILLNNLPTLIWLGNLACLEFHLPFHRYDQPDYPTELVFDLDPSLPDFLPVVEVALQTREALQQIGLDGLVKTSGATGLQIYVPIEPIYTYEQTRKVSSFIAKYLVEQNPEWITIERKVKNRGKKVYFDYLQHGKGKTLIAPYSPRAVKEATISTPLSWEELPSVESPKQFHQQMIFERLEKIGDLFRPLLEGPRYRLDHILTFLDQHLSV